MTIKCKNCGGTKLDMQKVNTHIGAYCANCGEWIKWVGKTELLEMNNTVKSFTVSNGRPSVMNKVYKFCGKRCATCRLLDYERNVCALPAILKEK